MKPTPLVLAAALAAGTLAQAQMPPTPSTNENLVRRPTVIALATVAATADAPTRGETHNGIVTLNVAQVLMGTAGPTVTAHYCRRSLSYWTVNTVMNLVVGEQRVR